MAELPDLEISKLPTIDAVNKDTDYLVISKESSAFATGYGSFKVTASQLMTSTGELWTDLVGTLVTGDTSVTIQSDVITTDSTIDVYTEDGTEWNSITVTTGQVVVTFDAQVADLAVKVRVS